MNVSRWVGSVVLVVALGLGGCGDDVPTPPPTPPAPPTPPTPQADTAAEAAAVAPARAGAAGGVSPSADAHAAVIAAIRSEDGSPAQAVAPAADAPGGRAQGAASAGGAGVSPAAGGRAAGEARPGPAPAPGPTPRPETAVIFREQSFTDPGMNNVVATTMLVPEGWEVQGGMLRPSVQLYNMPVVADIRVTAPDGRQVHFFPSFSFEFNHMQPGQVMQPTMGGNLYLPLPESPGRWLLEMAQLHPDPTVSDLRLVAEEDVPALTQQLRQQNAMMYQIVEQGNQTGASMGLTAAFDTQASKVVLNYTQGGKQLEETVLITWQYYVSMQNGRVTSGSWAIPMMRSFRGPVGSGYLVDPVLSAIVRSVRPNPRWEQEMANYWAELARIKQKGHNDRMANWRDHNQKMQKINSEINDIIVGGYNDRMASMDRSHARTIDAIREETPYTTPGGQTVKLPSFYDHVYTDSNGRYILNNDSFYNPNTDPTLNNVNWERIEAQR